MKIASHRIVAGALILSMSLVGTGFPLPNPAVGKAVEAGKSAPSKEVSKANTWLAGKLLVTGAATINGKKALSGSTVFSENRIAVANTAGNQALLNLGQLGRIDMGPGTELVLRLANGLISGELLAGEAVIKNNAGVKVALRTAAGLVTADGRTATITVANAESGGIKNGSKDEREGTGATAGSVVNGMNTGTMVALGAIAGGAGAALGFGLAGRKSCRVRR